MDEIVVNGVKLPEAFHRSKQEVQLPLGGKIFGAYDVRLYQGHGKTLGLDDEGNFSRKEQDYPLVVLTEAETDNPDESGTGVPISWFIKELVAPQRGELGIIFKIFGPSAHVVVAMDSGNDQKWVEYTMGLEEPKRIEMSNPMVQEFIATVGDAIKQQVGLDLSTIDADTPQGQALLNAIVNSGGNPMNRGLMQAIMSYGKAGAGATKASETLELQENDVTPQHVTELLSAHRSVLEARNQRLDALGM